MQLLCDAHRYLHVRHRSAQASAQFDQASMLFDRKTIRSPADGLVVGKIVSLGEAVSNLAVLSILYTIAEDISKMEVKLEIDETLVGKIRNGMKARLTIDAFPREVYEGVITKISNNPIEVGGAVTYKATIELDNPDLKFRPGMTVNAEVLIADVDNAVAVPGHVFTINPEIIAAIAQLLEYDVVPLETVFTPQQYGPESALKAVWVVDDKRFVQKLVRIGAYDGSHYEVFEGLTSGERVVSDTIEENAMQKFFKKFFNTGL